LNVPLAAVKIASGQRGRLKRIEVHGARAEQIRAVAFFAHQKPRAHDR
jgi:hypothetical protein